MVTKLKGLVIFLLVSALFGSLEVSIASETKDMVIIDRISPEEAREKVQSGKSLLVCSYDDRTCEDLLFEGAMLRSEFESRLHSIGKDQEIIFYCG